MAGTPPYVFPPFGNIPNNWVLFGDGHFGPAGGEGAAAELLYIADLSTVDVTVTLPDPATLPDPKATVSVKVVNANGTAVLTIEAGIAGTIDGSTTPITTLINNQGYRFRLADSADVVLPDGTTETGWVCTQTAVGGDDFGPGPAPPPIVNGCEFSVPLGIVADVQEFPAGGTWTNPLRGTYCLVTVIGGGAGGGSGITRGWAGTGEVGGGGAGGGGAKITNVFSPFDLPATVPVAIGSGGNGGIGVFGDTGNNGSDGGTSSFGNPGDLWHVIAYGGAAGTGGLFNGPGTGGGGGGGDGPGIGAAGGLPNGTAGSNATGTGGGGAGGGDVGNAECGGAAGSDAASGATGYDGGSALYGASGGGGGGRGTDGDLNTSEPGGAGGLVGAYTRGGGAAGGARSITHGVPAGSGSDGAAGSAGTCGNGGGGGGGSTTGGGPAAAPAGNGGNGGFPGGPGGGGGSAGGSTDGTSTPGNGGNGSGGFVRVVCW